MNFSIKKEILLKLISISENASSRNVSLPILSNILFESFDNLISVTSTDLDIGITISVPTKTSGGDKALINPKILSGVAARAPGPVIKIKKKENSILLEQKGYNASIQSEDGKDFPKIPKTESKTTFSIPPSEILPALAQVINSVSVSDSKPELSGVLFSFNSKEIVLASTDGFRLSEKKLPSPPETEGEGNYIIPAKSINALLRVFQDSEEDIHTFFEEGQVFFKGKSGSADIELVSNIIEGSYPEYKTIIPKEFICSVALNKKDLAEQVKACGIFSQISNIISVEVSGDLLTMSGEDAARGSLKSSLNSKKEGEDYKCSINNKYLTEGLDNIKESSIFIRFSKKDGPLLIEGEKDRDYIYLLMPVKG